MDRRRLAYLIAFAAIALASLWIRAGLPVVAFGSALHDDALFIRLADSLSELRWLGDFDQRTLAKGPGFPAFLALVSTLGLPLKLVEQAIYLGASAGMSYVVVKLTRRPLFGLIVFGALALNPVLFSAGYSRIIRDNLYLALSLALVAGVAYLALVRRASSRWPRSLALGSVVGLIGAWFWLVREEGIWLLPALALLLVPTAWRWLRTLASMRRRRGHVSIRTALAAPTGFLLVFLATVGAVMTANGVRYGVPVVSDLRDGSLPAAYGALTRIETGAWERYVVVPEAARESAYEVSPAMAELRQYLDGDAVKRWIENGCEARAISADPSLLSPDCDDYYAGWFVWAFRESVAAAGHWSSGPESQAFMARIAAEIDSACSSGRLACSAPRTSVEAPWRPQFVAEVIGLLPAALERLTAGAGIGGLHSTGDIDSLLHMADLAGAPISTRDPEEPVTRLAGWVASTSGVPSVALTTVPGRSPPLVTDIGFMPATDVYEAFEARGETNWLATRFIINSTCPGTDCELVISVDGEPVRSIPISDLRRGRIAGADPASPDDTLRAHLDLADVASEESMAGLAQVSQADDGIQGQVARSILGIYQLLIPAFSLLAALGVVLATLLRPVRRRYWPLIVLTAACALAVLTRLTLVALLEVTAWPGALSGPYAFTASPFLIAFAVCGTLLVVVVARDLLGRRPTS